MQKLFKLTGQDWKTRQGEYNEVQWGPGIEHEAKGLVDQKLCTNGWIHAYTDPLLAVLLNPLHADFLRPILWVCEGVVGLDDNGLKVGCRKLKTIEMIPLPAVSMEQRVRFAILCAKEVYRQPAWNLWADAWLTGDDRTAASSWSTMTTSWAAMASSWAAESAAAAAAEAASWAAASAAKAATRAVARAATRAVEKDADLDLIALAREACNA